MLVKMVNSVGEYAAGESYDLDDEESDRFVLLGYADGELSREYSLEELAAEREKHQTVGL
jgi:hypothetical protein